MIIALTDFFLEKEYTAVQQFFSRKDLKKAILKIDTSAVSLGSIGAKGVKLLKVRLTGRPAGRMVLLLVVDADVCLPLVIRLKKDKLLGENISLSNSRFRKLVLRHMGSVLADYQENKYTLLS